MCHPPKGNKVALTGEYWGTMMAISYQIEFPDESESLTISFTITNKGGTKTKKTHPTVFVDEKLHQLTHSIIV